MVTGNEKCRYFISSRGHCIKCQGLIDNTTMKNVFAGPTDEALEKKAQHFDTYCADPYNAPNCPAYRAIERGAVSHE